MPSYVFNNSVYPLSSHIPYRKSHSVPRFSGTISHSLRFGEAISDDNTALDDIADFEASTGSSPAADPNSKKALIQFYGGITAFVLTLGFAMFRLFPYMTDSAPSPEASFLALGDPSAATSVVFAQEPSGFCHIFYAADVVETGAGADRKLEITLPGQTRSLDPLHAKNFTHLEWGELTPENQMKINAAVAERCQPREH